MNSEERTQLKLIFDLLDKDCDGFINVKDLKKANSSIGESLGDKDITDMIKDGSKGIDFDQFVKIYSERWSNFDDANDIEDGFRVLTGRESKTSDAKIVRDSLMNGSQEGKTTAETFIKANKITGEESFQTEEFIKIIKK